MSKDSEREAPPIESREQLVELLRQGEKPKDAWRIGVEHEKLPLWCATRTPVDYEHGIRPLLLGLERYGWTPLPSREQPIAAERAGATISLEPGGQVELAGAPLASVHETSRELSLHMHELLETAWPLGFCFTNLGLRPFERTDDMPWMPKERYRVMRDYLPARGRNAQAMMLLTATTQANVDYASEADMVAKMRCAMAISPIVAAIFANSPYRDGRWSGYRTTRYAIWRDVDPDRCGLLPFVFEDDFGYARYVDYILDVPMFFIRRHGAYVPMHGMTLRRFVEEGWEGERATLVDFENQLAAVFPEVRLKTFLEVRSADAGPREMGLALAALWKGILYDADALKEAWALTSGFDFGARLAMQSAAAQDALRGHGPGWHLGELATALVEIARGGLGRQARLDEGGHDESVYLDPLLPLVGRRETLADRAVWRFGAGPLDDDGRRALLLESAYRV